MLGEYSLLHIFILHSQSEHGNAPVGYGKCTVTNDFLNYFGNYLVRRSLVERTTAYSGDDVNSSRIAV